MLFYYYNNQKGGKSKGIWDVVLSQYL